jgi:hypothetical protein
MYRKNLTPEEALESIKLRMNYDSSKTLNENKKLIYEQGVLQTAALALGYGPVSIERAKELGKQGLLDTYFSKTSGSTSSQNPIMSIGKAFQKGVEKVTQAVTDSRKKSQETVPPKKVVPIPTELKDIEGVKNFQDWLDKKYLGWHDKYKALYRSIPKGYGKYGPRTQKWWKEKGQEYLDSLKVSTETEVTSKPTNTSASTQPTTPSTTSSTTPFKPSASKGFSKFAQSQFGNSTGVSPTAETNQKEKVADENTKF